LQTCSKSGPTVNSIEFERFKSHEVLLPPMAILKKKLNKLENFINKEETTHAIVETTNSVEALKASILSKAFRGELGTNDRTEESAIELLKEVLQKQL
jgi:type I restriction enzyme, S subunit